MSRKDQKSKLFINKVTKNKWLIGTVVLTVAGLLGFMAIDLAIGTMGTSAAHDLAAAFVLVDIVAATVSIVSIFKLPTWRKLAAVICALISIGLAFQAYFVTWISGYQF